jgi:hypothetical protein
MNYMYVRGIILPAEHQDSGEVERVSDDVAGGAGNAEEELATSGFLLLLGPML